MQKEEIDKLLERTRENLQECEEAWKTIKTHWFCSNCLHFVYSETNICPVCSAECEDYEEDDL